MGGESIHLAGDAVVETRADGDQQVAVAHRLVGPVGAVHAEHPHRERMVAGERAKSLQGHGDRNLLLDGELAQLLRSLGADDAAADVEERALGLGDHFRRLLHLVGVALDGRLEAANVNAFRPFEDALGVEHILRHIDQHRAGPSVGGEVKRLADGRGQLAHILDEEVVLGDGARDADDVRLLEGVVANERARHLAGEDHERRGVHVGVGDAGDGVGRAGAGGDEHHAGPAGGAGVALGHVGRALLVAHQNVLDILDIVQGFVNLQQGPAGVAEDVLDLLTPQTLEKYFGSDQFVSVVVHGSILLIDGKAGRPQARRHRLVLVSVKNLFSAPRRYWPT